jgi:hypothetical protein
MHVYTFICPLSQSSRTHIFYSASTYIADDFKSTCVFNGNDTKHLFFFDARICMYLLCYQHPCMYLLCTSMRGHQHSRACLHASLRELRHSSVLPPAQDSQHVSDFGVALPVSQVAVELPGSQLHIQTSIVGLAASWHALEVTASTRADDFVQGDAVMAVDGLSFRVVPLVFDSNEGLIDLGRCRHKYASHFVFQFRFSPLVCWEFVLLLQPLFIPCNKCAMRTCVQAYLVALHFETDSPSRMTCVQAIYCSVTVECTACCMQ